MDGKWQAVKNTRPMKEKQDKNKGSFGERWPDQTLTRVGEEEEAGEKVKSWGDWKLQHSFQPMDSDGQT